MDPPSPPLSLSQNGHLLLNNGNIYKAADLVFVISGNWFQKTGGFAPLHPGKKGKEVEEVKKTSTATRAQLQKFLMQ